MPRLPMPSDTEAFPEKTRAAVRHEVLRILREHNTAAIIVTHDREDAIQVADRIAEMDHGRIVRTAAAEVFRREWTVHPFQRVAPSASGGAFTP